MRRPTHYETLSLPRDATPEQVERAYHFFAGMYEEAALATYSLLDTEEQRDARARIRQAYEVLHDPVQRDLYDRSLEEGTPLAPGERGQAAAPVHAPPRPPDPPAGAEIQHVVRVLPEPVTGESLRKTREERSITLQEIAADTKIGVRFLEYIESDRHSDLPAVVYIRGFVQEYARCLGLDPRRTADSYLKRVKP
ncbi:MAG TPA: helix-turn-helix domain-containing protein [Vicinamibacteria bacterium]|nr:helix-turn-helix domain-containing protein [Vicinamibacteria bacterium]